MQSQARVQHAKRERSLQIKSKAVDNTLVGVALPAAAAAAAAGLVEAKRLHARWLWRLLAKNRRRVVEVELMAMGIEPTSPTSMQTRLASSQGRLSLTRPIARPKSSPYASRPVIRNRPIPSRLAPTHPSLVHTNVAPGKGPAYPPESALLGGRPERPPPNSTSRSSIQRGAPMLSASQSDASFLGGSSMAQLLTMRMSSSAAQLPSFDSTKDKPEFGEQKKLSRSVERKPPSPPNGAWDAYSDIDPASTGGGLGRPSSAAHAVRAARAGTEDTSADDGPPKHNVTSVRSQLLDATGGLQLAGCCAAGSSSSISLCPQVRRGWRPGYRLGVSQNLPDVKTLK